MNYLFFGGKNFDIECFYFWERNIKRDYKSIRYDLLNQIICTEQIIEWDIRYVLKFRFDSDSIRPVY